MKKSGRYKTDGLVEDQYENGSKGLVLKNLLHIKDKREIEEIETIELYRATDELTEIYDQDHQFTAADIRNMHRNWLGKVYEWAGKYRQVTISKGGFTFALPKFIPQLMDDFEKKELSLNTPCNFKNRKEQTQALAIVHIELLLIHPFREGNGRLSRLSWQCSWPCRPDYLPWISVNLKGKEKRSILLRCERGWIEITNPWKRFSTI